MTAYKTTVLLEDKHVLSGISDPRKLDAVLDHLSSLPSVTMEGNRYCMQQICKVLCKIRVAVAENDDYIGGLTDILMVLCDNNQLDIKCSSSTAVQLLKIATDDHCPLHLLNRCLRCINGLLKSKRVLEYYRFADADGVSHQIKILGRKLFLVGDYETQGLMLETAFRLIEPSQRLLWSSEWFPEDNILQAAFLVFQVSQFELQCRNFLNQLNHSLGKRRRVFSYVALSALLGEVEALAPAGSELWIDFNMDASSISFYCADLNRALGEGDRGMWDSVVLPNHRLAACTVVPEKKIQRIYCRLNGPIWRLFPEQAGSGDGQYSHLHGDTVVLDFDAEVKLDQLLRKIYGKCYRGVRTAYYFLRSKPESDSDILLSGDDGVLEESTQPLASSGGVSSVRISAKQSCRKTSESFVSLSRVGASVAALSESQRFLFSTAESASLTPKENNSLPEVPIPSESESSETFTLTKTSSEYSRRLGQDLTEGSAWPRSKSSESLSVARVILQSKFPPSPKSSQTKASKLSETAKSSDCIAPLLVATNLKDTEASECPSIVPSVDLPAHPNPPKPNRLEHNDRTLEATLSPVSIDKAQSASADKLRQNCELEATCIEDGLKMLGQVDNSTRSQVEHVSAGSNDSLEPIIIQETQDSIPRSELPHKSAPSAEATSKVLDRSLDVTGVLSLQQSASINSPRASDQKDLLNDWHNTDHYQAQSTFSLTRMGLEVAAEGSLSKTDASAMSADDSGLGTSLMEPASFEGNSVLTRLKFTERLHPKGSVWEHFRARWHTIKETSSSPKRESTTAMGQQSHGSHSLLQLSYKALETQNLQSQHTPNLESGSKADVLEPPPSGHSAKTRNRSMSRKFFTSRVSTQASDETSSSGISWFKKRMSPFKSPQRRRVYMASGKKHAHVSGSGKKTQKQKQSFGAERYPGGRRGGKRRPMAHTVYSMSSGDSDAPVSKKPKNKTNKGTLQDRYSDTVRGSRWSDVEKFHLTVEKASLATKRKPSPSRTYEWVQAIELGTSVDSSERLQTVSDGKPDVGLVSGKPNTPAIAKGQPVTNSMPAGKQSDLSISKGEVSNRKVLSHNALEDFTVTASQHSSTIMTSYNQGSVILPQNQSPVKQQKELCHGAVDDQRNPIEPMADLTDSQRRNDSLASLASREMEDLLPASPVTLSCKVSTSLTPSQTQAIQPQSLLLEGLPRTKNVSCEANFTMYDSCRSGGRLSNTSTRMPSPHNVNRGRIQSPECHRCHCSTRRVPETPRPDHQRTEERVPQSSSSWYDQSILLSPEGSHARETEDDNRPRIALMPLLQSRLHEETQMKNIGAQLERDIFSLSRKYTYTVKKWHRTLCKQMEYYYQKVMTKMEELEITARRKPASTIDLVGYLKEHKALRLQMTLKYKELEESLDRLYHAEKSLHKRITCGQHKATRKYQRAIEEVRDRCVHEMGKDFISTLARRLFFTSMDNY